MAATPGIRAWIAAAVVAGLLPGCGGPAGGPPSAPPSFAYDADETDPSPSPPKGKAAKPGNRPGSARRP